MQKYIYPIYLNSNIENFIEIDCDIEIRQLHEKLRYDLFGISNMHLDNAGLLSKCSHHLYNHAPLKDFFPHTSVNLMLPWLNRLRASNYIIIATCESAEILSKTFPLLSLSSTGLTVGVGLPISPASSLVYITDKRRNYWQLLPVTKLNKENIEQFFSIYKKLSSNPYDFYFLNYYLKSLSYSSDSLEERNILLCGALEILLETDKTNDHIKDVLPKRINSVLNTLSIEFLKKTLKIAYDYRKIIHGKVMATNMSKEEFLNIAELTRQVIIARLNKPHLFEKNSLKKIK